MRLAQCGLGIGLLTAVAFAQVQSASRNCGAFEDPHTRVICVDSSTIYATASAAASAPPASLQDAIDATPTPKFHEQFTCDLICPPGEVPGCEKKFKYVQSGSPSVSAVAVPGGYKSRTCYTTTRTEGCTECILDPT
jgi:hypothetical protein